MTKKTIDSHDVPVEELRAAIVQNMCRYIADALMQINNTIDSRTKVAVGVYAQRIGKSSREEIEKVGKEIVLEALDLVVADVKASLLVVAVDNDKEGISKFLKDI